MSTALDTLLNGATLEEFALANGKAIHEIASRKTRQPAKVTQHVGFISVEMYPEFKKPQKNESRFSRFFSKR